MAIDEDFTEPVSDLKQHTQFVKRRLCSAELHRDHPPQQLLVSSMLIANTYLTTGFLPVPPAG
jgi:hypothetical protein